MSGHKKELRIDDGKVDSFYAMVRKWTYNDYITPKAKAEILVDMLISEFIEDIFNSKAFNDCIGRKDTAKLIAKEFPIKGYTEEKAKKDGYRVCRDSGIINSPAVDYLVKKGNKLYLVELKTNSGSFHAGQLFRMIMAKRSGPDKIFAHYAEVLQHTDSKRKYQSQLKRMWEVVADAAVPFGIEDLNRSKADKVNDERLSDLKRHFRGFSESFRDGADIVYLTLDQCPDKLSGKFLYDGPEGELKIELRGRGDTESTGAVRKYAYSCAREQELFYTVSMNRIKLYGDKKALWSKVRKILDKLPVDEI